MKKMSIIVLAVVMLALGTAGGCTSNPPRTAQEAVFTAISVDYETALDVAIAYDSLPPCELPSAPVVCSSAGIVHAIKAAKDKASPLVKAAKAAVLDPNFGASNVQTAIVLAQQAVAALTAITNQLTPPAP